MNSTNIENMEGPAPAEQTETDLIKTEAKLSEEVSDAKKNNEALKGLIKYLGGKKLSSE